MFFVAVWVTRSSDIDHTTATSTRKSNVTPAVCYTKGKKLKNNLKYVT